jgi:hypothetical protein
MIYKFIVENEDGEVVFRTETESLERVEEEIGRYERNLKDGYKPVGTSVWIK